MLKPLLQVKESDCKLVVTLLVSVFEVKELFRKVATMAFGWCCFDLFPCTVWLSYCFCTSNMLWVTLLFCYFYAVNNIQQQSLFCTCNNKIVERVRNSSGHSHVGYWRKWHLLFWTVCQQEDLQSCQVSIFVVTLSFYVRREESWHFFCLLV